MSSTPVAIGVIGGSGLYDLEGLEDVKEITVETPYGKPSDALVSGKLHGRQIYFLPRHARGHLILPTELNHQANIWALRSLNVRYIIAVSAVGSLKEELQPCDVLLFDQFIDKTSRREHHTFFGHGIGGHISFADPISGNLRSILSKVAKDLGKRHTDGGIYVNMDGPAFSTRAESEQNRASGASCIGMTNLPEAKLAREAEIALASLAMITDYDSWKIEEHPVTAAAVMSHVSNNAATAKAIIREAVKHIPLDANWPEHRALDGAIMTDKKLWPKETVEKLKPILERILHA